MRPLLRPPPLELLPGRPLPADATPLRRAALRTPLHQRQPGDRLPLGTHLRLCCEGGEGLFLLSRTVNLACRSPLLPTVTRVDWTPSQLLSFHRSCPSDHPSPPSFSNRNQNSILVQKGFRPPSSCQCRLGILSGTQVARSCARGELPHCSCDGRRRGDSGDGWSWAGCSDNLPYGLRLSRRFIDGARRQQRRRRSLRALMDSHNNEVSAQDPPLLPALPSRESLETRSRLLRRLGASNVAPPLLPLLPVSPLVNLWVHENQNPALIRLRSSAKPYPFPHPPNRLWRFSSPLTQPEALRFQAGRAHARGSAVTSCVCRGAFASCSQKACSRRVGSLRAISAKLHRRLRKAARLSDQQPPLPPARRRRHLPRDGPSRKDLVYLSDSPALCQVHHPSQGRQTQLCEEYSTDCAA